MRKILFLFSALLLAAGPAFSQTDAPATGSSTAFYTSFQRGITLYGEGKWLDAAAYFRKAQEAAATDDERAEAVYWLCFAEESGGDFEGAVRDLDVLERIPGGAARKEEIPYLRGRAFYSLGRYNEAIVLLKGYADHISADSANGIARKSAALYWTGESLFALGQFDKAQDVFFVIAQQYPQSVKYEASVYRIALIYEKKVGQKLLDILKQTHEESLKTIEEYQRRESIYTQALVAYQKRIAALEASLHEAGIDATTVGSDK
ncbi:MAG: tetratricopeptide repeat protein [Treponema sp.]|jgi:tetratricopeptide (TPR) repeat protein|nr:tetratricopeptide repeat protein [Treponema sp.]